MADVEVLQIDADTYDLVESIDEAKDAVSSFTSVVQASGEAIAVAGDTYDVLPAKVNATTAAVSGLSRAEEKLLADIRAENVLDEETLAVLDARAAAMGKLENNVVNAGAATQKFAQNIVVQTQQANQGLSRLHYQFFVLGQFLDDLQYVGEQGLRPIIGQIFQISPALGIVSLAIDQAARHWDKLEEAVAGTDFEERVSNYGRYFRELAQAIGLAKDKTTELKDEAQAADKALSAITGTEDKRRAEAVRRTIERLGGGDIVRDQLLLAEGFAHPGRTPREADQARQQISRNLGAALKGNEAAIAALIGAAPNTLFAQGVQSEIARTDPELQRQAKELEEAKKEADRERERQAREREREQQHAALQQERDLQDYIAQDERDSQRRLRRHQADQRRQGEVERKALEKAVEPFEAQGELAILQGVRGQFRSPRERAAFRAQAEAAIRREAQANLLAQGIEPGRAVALAQGAPAALSADLQKKALALQARGITGTQQTLALAEQLTATLAALEAKVARNEQTIARLSRTARQTFNTALNRRPAP